MAVSAPGAATVHAVTGDDGRAVAHFPATQQGWQDVTASVGQVPEHRLYLRRPVKRGQAAAAEGGVRRTVDASVLTAVRGPQTMSLQATPENLVVGGSGRRHCHDRRRRQPTPGDGRPARAVPVRVRGRLLRLAGRHDDHDGDR